MSAQEIGKHMVMLGNELKGAMEEIYHESVTQADIWGQQQKIAAGAYQSAADQLKTQAAAATNAAKALKLRIWITAIVVGVLVGIGTPMAYKTNLLVMNAGGYKFMDFVKVGTPLTLIMWLCYSWLLPWLYNV